MFPRVGGLRLVIVEINLVFLLFISPYIICHHFAWKDDLLAAERGIVTLFDSYSVTPL